MRLEDKLAAYLEYCEYRKQLDKKTLKAYRIDLRQYFEHVNADVSSHSVRSERPLTASVI